MINFKPVLQAKVQSVLETAVGPGSDPKEFIKTFDDHLHDIEFDALPFLVVNVRFKERDTPPEIGQPFGKYSWMVHVYYLDNTSDSYSVGEQRRDRIMARVEKALEINWQLDGLREVDTDGHGEYVYSSGVQMVQWDDSGQDEYLSFVSELYFEVNTEKY